MTHPFKKKKRKKKGVISVQNILC